MRDNL